MSLATVVIGLFGLVYAALAVVATRRPLLARLALREAVRRPGQSAVVVLGLMVGTVAIFAMQVLSDSFLESQTLALSWPGVASTWSPPTAAASSTPHWLPSWPPIP